MCKEKRSIPKGSSRLHGILLPRCLSRCEVAYYSGISPTLFDEMVKDGRMPKPIRINSRTVWDRHAIDAAIDALACTEVDDDEWEASL
jgi:predicted DNA-binding transcriptional regulator AlpA